MKIGIVCVFIEIILKKFCYLEKIWLNLNKIFIWLNDFDFVSLIIVKLFLCLVVYNIRKILYNCIWRIVMIS